MLEGVSLRDCFSVITSAEDVEVGKPDPRGYVQTMNHLAEKAKRELEPKDCLIVEDAPSVIKRAKAAGFITLGVASTTSLEKLADADYATPSLRLDEVKKHATPLRPILS
jgi:beta-phosphoglucomutase-like phosphatase (HAD superfamily)